LYRAIWRERTFYSHPAIVGVDHLIRHFPEHRKVALLADEPPPAAFNAFTIRPRRPTPLAFSSLPPSSMVARRSGGRLHLRALGPAGRIPVVLGTALERARQRLLADRASSSPSSPSQATALA
jgi:hypothetical protein